MVDDGVGDVGAVAVAAADGTDRLLKLLVWMVLVLLAQRRTAVYLMLNGARRE